MKLQLPNVTLVGIDCVDVERLIRAVDISCESIDFGQIKILSSLPSSDPRVLSIPHIASIEEYSLFCIRDLHKYVDTDYVLVVQYDGFVLNPASWTDEFLKYDYIGAPWLIEREYWFTKFAVPLSMKGSLVTGNGGFSLRSKRFVEASNELYQLGKIPTYHPEDVALCVWLKQSMEKRGLSYAPTDMSSRFSFEGSRDPYSNQFGFHGFKATNLDVWFSSHPGHLQVELCYRKEKCAYSLKKMGYKHIYHWSDAPGVVYPPHAHAGKVTLCIVSGSVTFSGGFEKTLVAGNIFDVPVGVLHTATVGADGCTYVVGEEIEGG